ncbi:MULTISPECIES: hypothetical protein [Caldimonas]|uniref:hypothetical protein n=1 Tax=Caldimonas TaxID=196013 RepID=UPI00035CE9A3|nr:hypothetical protein [Caldimonas manganoxidans]MCX7660776.1 hypothetical protein [Caldimonas manganoxidans]
MQAHSEPPFSVGKYLVSPLSRRNDAGGYAASVSIRSGRGAGTHDRVFRFATSFETCEGALRHAAEQGRLWAQRALLA